MSAPLRIAIAGLGTVGCGTVDIITQHRSMMATRTGRAIEIVAVSARERNRKRDIDLSAFDWEDDARVLANRNDVDVIIELIGGADGIAYDLVKAALQQGKHVVTANKALIAHHGAELATLAEKHQAYLLFEAAVAGGIPIIKLMKEGLAANRYNKLIGILNGTCNYILTTMETTGRSFDDVLQEAQALGYAEADPTFDVDGIDAAHKLAILSALAYGTSPSIDHMHCEGIRQITAEDMLAAKELGATIRLIGVASQHDEGIELRVHPAMLPKHTPIAEVDGVYNAVHVFGDAVGDIFIEGQGAGREPTASAVVADIMDVARGNVMPPFILPADQLAAPQILPMQQHEGAYYLRIKVADHPGVLATITNLFAEHEISVARLIQHEPSRMDEADIILMTHRTTERLMNAALSEIAALESVLAAPCLIRIEAP